MISESTVSADIIVGMSRETSRLEAWKAISASHAVVTERIQRALAATDLPPLSWYELLAAIDSCPAHRPSMSELAERLTFSRGGITKLVDRLQAAGLIERVSGESDRRSAHAQLTPAGDQMLDEMRAVYEAELGHYLSDLTDEEAQLISSALERVTARACTHHPPAEFAGASASRPTVE